VRGDLRLGDQLVSGGHAEANDSSPASGFHARRHGSAQIEHRMKIGGKHLEPALNGFLEEVDPMVWAGAIDQSIDAFPPPLNALGKTGSSDGI
jgi:hypothetical protein